MTTAIARRMVQRDPFDRYANIIRLFECPWMLPLHVLEKGIMVFSRAIMRTDEHAAIVLEWDEHEETPFLAQRPGRRFSRRSDHADERLLAEMGVTLTRKGTAVVPIVGVMAKRMSSFGISEQGVSSDMLTDVFDVLRQHDSVNTVALDIDSPGGSALGVEFAAQALRELSKKKDTIAVGNEMLASGAFYVASQANQIAVAPTAIVGSLGVYTTRVDRTKAEDESGIKVHVIRAGEFKADGHPSLPFTEEERERIQREVNVYYRLFTSAVKTGRELNQKDALALMDGTVEIGRDAVTRGFADTVASLSRTVRQLERPTSRTLVAA